MSLSRGNSRDLRRSDDKTKRSDRDYSRSRDNSFSKERSFHDKNRSSTEDDRRSKKRDRDGNYKEEPSSDPLRRSHSSMSSTPPSTQNLRTSSSSLSSSGNSDNQFRRSSSTTGSSGSASSTPSKVAPVQQPPQRPPIKPSPNSLGKFTLNGLKNVSKPLEDTASRVAQAWNYLDAMHRTYLSMNREELKNEKSKDMVQFDVKKLEFKLDQIDRKLSIIETDLGEADYQIEKLEQTGEFPDSYNWTLLSSSS
eukprot:TRINITY_DN8971_c0_g1_i1.p1 TRINITY_DN8971_c0_g1~~TRINITY_DN8971_c0_g1_i1.p1  ORF type:complete len:252 (-),score=49.18 TRINITY_DN8971_c0_g1_i1:76-831(-)